MRALFQQYPNLTWIALALLVGGLAFAALRYGFRRLRARAAHRGRRGLSHTLSIIQRVVLSFLVLVIGLLIAYGLLDAEHHALLNTHLQRVLWCGFVATFTNVA